MKRRISYSGVKSFLRCPALYELKHVHRATPVNVGYRSALAVGTAFHNAGAMLRAGMTLPQARGVAMGSIDEAAEDARGTAPTIGAEEAALKAAIRDRAMVDAMLRGYVDSFSHDEGPPIATDDNEIEFTMPLGNGWNFYGFIDAIVDDNVCYEMKTCSNTLTERIKECREGLQIHSYMGVMERHMGIECKGCVIDVIKKPVVTKQRKGESVEDWGERCYSAYAADPDRYFARVHVDYDEARADKALRDIRRVCDLIEINEAHRDGFMAVTGSGCKSSWGPCPYVGYCWYGNASRYCFNASQ